jgi:D-alanyl-D-alanine dipeptidase
MKKQNKNFVYIDEYDLLGGNFYWHKANEVGIPKEKLSAMGLKNERVLVHKDIIPPLKEADKILQKKGYRIFITEGYRSKELYQFINRKIAEKIGEQERDRILNMKDMPHSTGKSVDVALLRNGKKLILHDKKDGIDGYFVDFYKEGKNKNEQYQKLQEVLLEIMQNNGFRLGIKREYFHFNCSGNVVQKPLYCLIFGRSRLTYTQL